MPDPELADGADVLLRPLPELDLAELEPAEPELDELALDEPERDDEPDDECWVDAAAV